MFQLCLFTHFQEREEKEPDLDGAPIEEYDQPPPVEEDLDGLPIPRGISRSGSEDYDGKPLEESDLDGLPLSEDLDGMPCMLMFFVWCLLQILSLELKCQKMATTWVPCHYGTHRRKYWMFSLGLRKY
jgi:hypothetical protein